ncbi:MAG TPA: hypothetical protein PLP65_01430 [Bacteroidales bacterium]|nr:hypothetical protein [Bacteroidales bacterium]
MKKLFLVILAGGIMFTTCKKEETPNVISNKILIKKGVIYDAYLCDEYKDLYGNISYIIKNKLKSHSVTVKLDRDYHPKSLTHPESCYDSGDECSNVTINGEKVIIVRSDAK